MSSPSGKSFDPFDLSPYAPKRARERAGLDDKDPNVVLPYAPREARLLCDMYALDGQPWELCPRGFLHTMIARAGGHGLRVEAAFEYEFYLARQTDDGRFVPADDSLCFSSDGMDRQSGVIGAIVDALDQQVGEVARPGRRRARRPGSGRAAAAANPRRQPAAASG